MSPRPLPPAGRYEPAASAAVDAWTERLCFLLLLAIYAVRPLLPETFDRTQLSFLRGMGELRGPSPATTAWLDSLLLISALPLLLAPRRGPHRRTPSSRGFVAGVALLALSVALSTSFAADRRTALNAGAHLLAVLIGGAALARAASRRSRVHLIVAVLLACGAASAYKGYAQVRWEFAQTLESWTEYKAQLAQLGHDADAPEIENYERRLRSGEAFAYQSNPNIAASCLVMCLAAAAAALALAAQRMRRGDRNAAALFVIALALAAGMVAVLPLTGSMGAYVAAAAGLLTFVLLTALALSDRPRPRLALTLILAPYLLLIAAGTAYGLSRGTLPHASLAFRWQYWTAGVAALADAPLTGFGRENFGAAYLVHKRPEATEEVKNAHDLWITLLVELGPLGLLGGFLVVVSTIRAACGEGGTGDPPGTNLPHSPHGTRTSDDRGWFLNGTLLATATLGLHAILSGLVLDFNTALIWAVELAGAFGLALFFALNALRATTVIDNGRLLAAGLTAGVVAVLVHNLVCFSLFTPAGLSLCVALAAAALAAQYPSPGFEPTHASGPQRRALLRLAGCVLIPGAHVLVITAPTALSETLEQRVALLAARAPAPAVLLEAAEDLAAVDPLDSHGLRTAARAAAGLSQLRGLPDDERVEYLDAARRILLRAIDRNPRSHASWAFLAEINERREDPLLNLARPNDAADALHACVDAWTRALELYPTNPRTRISAGQACLRLWQDTLEPADGQTAVAHFCAALAIDHARPPHEVMRLRPAELDRIRRGLDELCAAGLDTPCSPPPATAPRPPSEPRP